MGIADVGAVDLAQAVDGFLLMLTPGVVLVQALINKIIKAGQGFQTDGIH